MTIGFVLINVSPGKEKEIFNIMTKWNEIRDLAPLFGDYDIIAKIETIDYESLSDIVLHKIRSIDGITDTKTLPMAKF